MNVPIKCLDRIENILDDGDKLMGHLMDGSFVSRMNVIEQHDNKLYLVTWINKEEA